MKNKIHNFGFDDLISKVFSKVCQLLRCLELETHFFHIGAIYIKNPSVPIPYLRYAMHRSSQLVADLKELYPQLEIHAINFVHFVEIRSKLFSEHFKNGVEDVSFRLDHEGQTVKLNAINPYEMLAKVDDEFKPADNAYSQVAEEILSEIVSTPFLRQY